MTPTVFDAFQVIADPSRRQMLQLLANERLTINTLASHFDMSRPAVSKHIRILHDSGFIAIEDSGRERYCTLKQDGFDRLQEWISYFDSFWVAKLGNLEQLMSKKKKK